MRRIADQELTEADALVLSTSGGVARTAEHYDMLSTGWAVRPIGEEPHATEVSVWRGQSLVVIHCGGTPVTVHREPEHMGVYGDWVQLVLPCTGKLLVRQHGSALDVGAGELASLVYRHEFEIVEQPGASMFIVHLSAASLRSRGLRTRHLAGRKWGGGPLVPALAVLLEALFSHPQEPPSLPVEHAILEVIVNLLAMTPEGLSNSAQLRARMMEIIHAEFNDPDLTAAKLAQRLGVSRRSLYETVENDTMSIAETVRFRRISHGRRLLASRPDLSMRRIAKLCGYRGPDQFSRAFKTETGTTPTAFRAGLGVGAQASN